MTAARLLARLRSRRQVWIAAGHEPAEERHEHVLVDPHKVRRRFAMRRWQGANRGDSFGDVHDLIVTPIGPDDKSKSTRVSVRERVA